MWQENWEKEDRVEGVSREVCTMRALSQMATSVLQFLKLTYDCPDLNSSLGMPVLDTEMWVVVENRETGIPKGALLKDDRV